MCPACPRPRLLPENARAVSAFMAAETQLRYAPSGRPTGLDYAGVEALLRFEEARPKRRRRMFRDIRVMERALVQAQAEWAREEREERERGRSA